MVFQGRIINNCNMKQEGARCAGIGRMYGQLQQAGGSWSSEVISRTVVDEVVWNELAVGRTWNGH